MPGRRFVVVPDGLEADARGRPTGEPSFVYRCVLDRLREELAQDDAVLLAPANRFGGEVSEQAAALRYLRARGVTQPVTCFEVDDSRYVDTRGNARLLRAHLEAAAAWPPERAVLVAYHLHLPRARLAFEQEGFAFESGLAVRPRGLRPAPIVRRLWYYRHPSLHRIYEAVGRLVYKLHIR